MLNIEVNISGALADTFSFSMITMCAELFFMPFIPFLSIPLWFTYLSFLWSIWQCNEIRKTNSNLIVIGKTTVDNDKEDFDNDADDDDADHGDESEGEEFEQETAWRCFHDSVLLLGVHFRAPWLHCAPGWLPMPYKVDVEYSHETLPCIPCYMLQLVSSLWILSLKWLALEKW